MSDRQHSERLRREAAELWDAIQPDPAFLERLARLEDREGRPLIPPGLKPLRPTWWQRLRMGPALEVLAASVALVALGTLFAWRALAPAPGGPAALQPGGKEAPAMICQKPADDSGIDIALYRGESDATEHIQPGWAIPFPNVYFFVGVFFPEPVDPSSITVTVDPPAWQYQPRSDGPEGAYFFGVFPDGQMEKRGPTGWVTVTLAGAKSLTGQPLQPDPIQFRLWMTAPIQPGEPEPRCPGL